MVAVRMVLVTVGVLLTLLGWWFGEWGAAGLGAASIGAGFFVDPDRSAE